MVLKGLKNNNKQCKIFTSIRLKSIYFIILINAFSVTTLLIYYKYYLFTETNVEIIVILYICK